jgi:hypothetical protein
MISITPVIEGLSLYIGCGKGIEYPTAREYKHHLNAESGKHMISSDECLVPEDCLGT